MIEGARTAAGRSRLATVVAVGVALLVAGCASTPEKSVDEEPPRRDEPESHHAESEIMPVGASPATGTPESPLTMTVFADPLDPAATGLFREIRRARRELERSEARVVYHFVPADHRVGAPLVARALIYADRRGAFLPAYRRILARQADLLEASSAGAVRRIVAAEFEELGLELPEESWPDRVRTAVEEDRSLAESLEIEETPQLFLNGTRVQSSIEPGQLVGWLRETAGELREMEVRGGLAPEEVYRASVEARYREPSGSAESRAVQYIPVREGDPVRGAMDAPPVTAVLFIRYTNPMAESAEAMLSALVEEFPETLRYVVKPLPRREGEPVAARLALAAHRVGAFEPVHRALLERRVPPATEAEARKVVEDLEVDAEAVLEAYRNRDLGHDLRILTHEGARAAGMLPHLYVNGLSFDRIPPYTTLRSAIREQSHIELKAAGEGEGDVDPYRAAVEHNKREYER